MNKIELEILRRRLESAKHNRPGPGESFNVTFDKFSELYDLLIRLADEMLKDAEAK